MDISHYFGGDLLVSVNGDLLAVDGITLSQQRILRRLLTPPGAYIWHLDYGAGLPAYIGVPLSTSVYQKLVGLITSQVLLEDAVSKTPAPVVTLSADQGQGSLFCSIQYTEANTNALQLLNFNVSN